MKLLNDLIDHETFFQKSKVDVYNWVHHKSTAAIAKELKEFPVIEEYIPTL